MADFRDHAETIERAGYGLAGISVDPLSATALLQAELFIPFDLLSDLDRSVITAWGLLNDSEHDGIPVPSVFAVGPGRRVLARSIDSMTRQAGPAAFLAAIDSPAKPPERRLVLPRLLQHFGLSRRVSRGSSEP